MCTAEQLANLLLERIEFLQRNNRLTVLNLVSDNNALNRKAFSILTSRPGGVHMISFPNPSDETQTIFCKPDDTHLFKNWRNNWERSKDDCQTLLFPSFEDIESDSSEISLLSAEFKHLRTLQAEQEGDLIKSAFRLTRKAVYPGPFERQNVNFVDAVFHRSTIAALEEKPDIEDTVVMLKLGRKWWDMMSNLSRFKAERLKNENCRPFERASYAQDERLTNFLPTFVKWLEVWRDCKEADGKRFSNETLDALHNSALVTIALVNYVFENIPDVEYILTGKFSTDKLEGIFGKLRQLSGSMYRITTVQANESLKKIRDRHWISKTLIAPEESPDATPFGEEELKLSAFETTKESLDPFLSIFSEDYMRHVSNVEESRYVYIAGFCARRCYSRLSSKSRQTCDVCWNALIESKGEKIGSQFFDSLQAGGLIAPSQLSLEILKCMTSILLAIDNNSYLKSLFLSFGLNQRAVLVQLTKFAFEVNSENDDTFDVAMKCCSCGTEMSKLILKFSIPLSNVLLNAFSSRSNSLWEKQEVIEKTRKAAKRRFSLSRKEEIAGEMKRKLNIFSA